MSMMKFLIRNSLLNIIRQRRRYCILGIMLLLCALLYGAVLPISSAARAYLDYAEGNESIGSSEETQAVNVLASEVSAYESGILVVGCVVIFYVSAMTVNKRISDAGILFALGMNKRAIFFGFFVEITVFSMSVLLLGYTVGGIAARIWTEYKVAVGDLTEELLRYYGQAGDTVKFILCSILLCGIPIIMLTEKIRRCSPVDLLRERK